MTPILGEHLEKLRDFSIFSKKKYEIKTIKILKIIRDAYVPSQKIQDPLYRMKSVL